MLGILWGEKMKKKVFISYAWDDAEEKDQKVKSFTQWLAVYLKKWGFDVLLDVYENHPGTKLDAFMSEGISTSRFVLCICTETYLKKMQKFYQNTKLGVFQFTLVQRKMSEKLLSISTRI